MNETQSFEKEQLKKLPDAIHATPARKPLALLARHNTNPTIQLLSQDYNPCRRRIIIHVLLGPDHVHNPV